MSTAPAPRHPIFARVWTQLSQRIEAEVGRFREELLAGLSGRVVEIGAGNGLNFAHYPNTVTEVIAVEPEPFLRERALEAAASAPVPVRVLDGVAEALPLQDASVDAAVCCLVLCSVADPRRAIAEIERVLVPGGVLRLLEHVRSDGGHARMQRSLDLSRIWPTLAGGCRCSRETLATVESAGFSVTQRREQIFPPRLSPINPVIIATAQRL
ncbi:MAG TPA: class I SAM-dependent methyltransferase [Solirubrobacteraceae bacterium]|nr:class I SAM-dependent methyltransferase [Solirubrobacteraceae bacterium]